MNANIDQYSHNQGLGSLSLGIFSGTHLSDPVGGNLDASHGIPMEFLRGTPLLDRRQKITTNLQNLGAIDYELVVSSWC